MKASEYLEHFKKLVERYGDLELVYIHDDEGNCYQKLVYTPSIGIFKGEFYGDMEEMDEHDKPNCICIN